MGRLDAGYAAEAGRDADAAAAVAAGGQGAEAGGQRRRRAATAAAGRVVGVPRVAAGFADEVLGGAGLSELGCVGLAQDDGAGGLDALDDDGVDLRHPVSEYGGAQGGGHALGQLQVLDGDGDAVERPQSVAAPDGFVGSAGIGQRLIRAEGQVGAEPRVQLVDALVEQLGEFHGGDFTGSNHAPDFGGGGKGEFGVHNTLLLVLAAGYQASASLP